MKKEEITLEMKIKILDRINKKSRNNFNEKIIELDKKSADDMLEKLDNI